MIFSPLPHSSLLYLLFRLNEKYCSASKIRTLTIEKSRARSPEKYQISFDEENSSWKFEGLLDAEGCVENLMTKAEEEIFNLLVKNKGTGYSLRELAEVTGYSEVHIRRTTKPLVRRGLINHHKHPKEKYWIYIINFDPYPDHPDHPDHEGDHLKTWGDDHPNDHLPNKKQEFKVGDRVEFLDGQSPFEGKAFVTGIFPQDQYEVCLEKTNDLTTVKSSMIKLDKRSKIWGTEKDLPIYVIERLVIGYLQENGESEEHQIICDIGQKSPAIQTALKNMAVQTRQVHKRGCYETYWQLRGGDYGNG